MRRDYVREAIELAVQRFGDQGDGMFNSANFGKSLNEVLGARGGMDGGVVQLILWNRQDVQQISGAHWLYRPQSLWRRLLWAIRGPREG